MAGAPVVAASRSGRFLAVAAETTQGVDVDGDIAMKEMGRTYRSLVLATRRSETREGIARRDTAKLEISSCEKRRINPETGERLEHPKSVRILKLFRQELRLL